MRRMTGGAQIKRFAPALGEIVGAPHDPPRQQILNLLYGGQLAGPAIFRSIVRLGRGCGVFRTAGEKCRSQADCQQCHRNARGQMAGKSLDTCRTTRPRICNGLFISGRIHWVANIPRPLKTVKRRSRSPDDRIAESGKPGCSLFISMDASTTILRFTCWTVRGARPYFTHSNRRSA